ncbi:zinc finger protein 271 isoform X1 [Ceratitis capitata]|uniref:zinc finger protein 271 isoform X1 n=1 Tax=Ceratitis capitata TaxID=7213 RepID=UPI00032A1E82|nr:zinc finger protein 271 isoform X1 [Ceratitis capitata]
MSQVQTQTDEILKKIYAEQKTLINFFDAILGFLKRNTNFDVIDAAERNRLQKYLSKELSLCDPAAESSPRLKSIAGEKRALAETNEICTVDKNLITKLELRSPSENALKTNSIPRFVKMGIINTEPSCYIQNVETPKPKIQNIETNIRKWRAILPKEQEKAQGDIQESIYTLNDKTKNIKSKRVYKCTECTDVFNSFRQLKVHEAIHPTKSEGSAISICIYCCSLYANAESLEKHINECHANGHYICVPCTKEYKSRGQLLKHVHSNAHNAKALLYYCGLCPRSEKSPIEFPSRSALQQHYQETHLLMPVNQDEDDVEIEMNEEFLDEFLLNNVNENSFNFSECWDALDLNLPDMLHMTNSDKSPTQAKDYENAEFLYKCPKCYDGFKQQKTLLQHIAHKHELPLLICSKCDASFKDYTQWIQHKETHQVQLGCRRNSKDKDKVLQCGICDKIFRSNPALNYHIKTHLRGFLDAPHECPYCKKCFHTDTNLKQHIRIVHCQNKRHTCKLCDKLFSTLDHLKKHVLSTHQNERKHICHVCAKSFTQLCHLKQHLNIHNRGKTHQCLKCDEKFWRKIDLQRHIIKKHN